jgi:N-methylhydantoinase A
MTSFRAGVDIGGTFTDIVLLGNQGERYMKKVSSSTVHDHARAIVNGLVAALDPRRLPPPALKAMGAE